MLAAALRARAGSAAHSTVASYADPPSLPGGVTGSRPLSVGWILLTVVLFGLLGGWIAGWLSSM